MRRVATQGAVVVKLIYVRPRPRPTGYREQRRHRSSPPLRPRAVGCSTASAPASLPSPACSPTHSRIPRTSTRRDFSRKLAYLVVELRIVGTEQRHRARNTVQEHLVVASAPSMAIVWASAAGATSALDAQRHSASAAAWSFSVQ